MKICPGRAVPILLKLLPIFERFVPFFLRFFPVFDRLIPRVVSYFLNMQLTEWKAKGLIKNYETNIVRLDKLSYKIDIRIVLTADQAKGRLNDLVAILID